MHNISRVINYTLIVMVLLGAAIYFYLREFHYQGKDHNELENFPLISQPDHITCGPTSCAMLLNYYGKNTNVEEVRKYAKTDLWTTKDGKKIGGTHPNFIKIALNHYNVPSEIEYGNLDKLKFYIDQGKPVIVMVRTSQLLSHYVVAIGYTQKEIIVADPGGGEREVLTNDQFKGCWSFKTDMQGEDVKITCPICKGKGYVGVAVMGKCDMCAGTGKIDPMASLLKILELRENTMIVPTILPCHSLDDVPKITKTKLGLSGDPVNLAFMGTKDALISAMIAAKWQPADPITFKSCVKLAKSVITAA